MSNHKNSTTGESDPIDITADQYVLAFLSFFTIALGGLMIGIIVGLISALMTRTTKDVHIMEPLILLGTGYLAYMGAELFHWSGIIR
jgi:NhaP-type Na+/H+ or K+/H+ antiporter